MKFEIPSGFERKGTRGVYMSDYAYFYLVAKKEIEGLAFGQTMDDVIFAQPDFIETMNLFFENSKPKKSKNKKL